MEIRFLRVLWFVKVQVISAFAFVQVLSSKMLEQETKYHQLSQEQLDNFSLDMNAAYARLKGMEDAISSKMHTCARTSLCSSGKTFSDTLEVLLSAYCCHEVFSKALPV